MSQLTFSQKLQGLWAAALTLESAARESLNHLPPKQKQDLQKALEKFEKTISYIKRA